MALLILGGVAGGWLLVAGHSTATTPSVAAPIVPSSNATGLGLNATATPTSGVAPLTVAFLATPYGGSPPYRVGVDFRDGTPTVVVNNSGSGTSTRVNHTYANAGTYAPLLWVNDSAGGSNTSSLTIAVTSGTGSGGNSSPRVYISGSTFLGVVPLNVTLDANVAGNATPTSFSWSFGDGTNGSGNPVSHLYTSAGTFLAEVRAAGLVNGTTVNASATIVVVNRSSCGSGNGTTLQVNGCVAPSSGPAPLTVTFTTQPSGGTGIYNVSFGFGDGSSFGLVRLAHPAVPYQLNHNYSAVGFYYPWIIVNDSAGTRVTQGFTVNVTGGNGTPHLTLAAVPSSGTAPLSVTLWANVSGNASPTAYNWRFGDGGNGTGTPIGHVYTHPGTYRAVVVVSGVGPNGSLAANTTIVVANGSGRGSGNGSLQVGLSAVPSSGSAPLNVTVTVNVTGGTAPYILAWCQYVGNGSCNLTNFAINVSAHHLALLHLFENRSGTITVLVRASDSNHSVTIATVGIVVGGGTPLSARITLNTTGGVAPLVVGLNGTVSGGTSPYTMQWFFGDGDVGSSLSGVVVAHTYTPGHYWAVLHVSDSSGHALVRAAPHEIDVNSTDGGGCALPLTLAPPNSLAGGIMGLPVSVLLVVVAAGGLGAGLAISAIGYQRLRRRLDRAEGETLALTMEGPLRPPAG
ncbi:MAG: PKD domain-containing protein [Thermoplasmata archaeon]|nr:PKD domain-containing protein [Thermoplasmata archaeon]